MHFFTGPVRGERWVRLLWEAAIGRMWTDPKPRPYPGEVWAFDNGAFGWAHHNQPFNWHSWNRRRWAIAGTDEAPSGLEGTWPYFAVLPDVPNLDARQVPVWELHEQIRWAFETAQNLPDWSFAEWDWYLAVQDGMTPA